MSRKQRQMKAEILRAAREVGIPYLPGEYALGRWTSERARRRLNRKYGVGRTK